MNYKIENGISGPIIIFNDGLKQETYFDIPNNILNVIKELEQDNRQLELKLQQKENIINKAKDYINNNPLYDIDGYENNTYLSGIDDEQTRKDLLEILERSDK